jgi:hypothetical protein
MKKEEEESTGFRVTDRRHFSETGERREVAEEAEVKKQPEAAKRAVDPSAKERPAEPTVRERPPGSAPRIDFPNYLLSYYTQALMFLGEVPNPVTNTVEEDLEGVRHTVEILEMLQAKTKGNLSSEEEQLMDSVLYELRMKFMAKAKKIKF